MVKIDKLHALYALYASPTQMVKNRQTTRPYVSPTQMVKIDKQHALYALYASLHKW